MSNCKLHQMKIAFSLTFLYFLLINDRSLFNFIYEYTLVQVSLFTKVLEYIFDCEGFCNYITPLDSIIVKWVVLRLF